MPNLCPLRPMTQVGNRPPTFGTCIGKECAWFDESECVVKDLSSIADSLYELQKNDKYREIVYER